MASITDNMSRYPFSVGSVLTTTVSSPLQNIETGARGAIIYIDVTGASGTLPTLLISIESKDPASGKFVSVPGVITTSIIGVSTQILTIAQGLTGVANSIINTPLPNAFRVTATIGGTAPIFTLSVGIQYTF